MIIAVVYNFNNIFLRLKTLTPANKKIESKNDVITECFLISNMLLMIRLLPSFFQFRKKKFGLNCITLTTTL